MIGYVQNPSISIFFFQNNLSKNTQRKSTTNHRVATGGVTAEMLAWPGLAAWPPRHLSGRLEPAHFTPVNFVSHHTSRSRDHAPPK